MTVVKERRNGILKGCCSDALIVFVQYRSHLVCALAMFRAGERPSLAMTGTFHHCWLGLIDGKNGRKRGDGCCWSVLSRVACVKDLAEETLSPMQLHPIRLIN